VPRGPDQEDDRGQGSEEVPDRRAVRCEQGVNGHGRARQENDGCDIAASRSQRLTANPRPDAFNEEDWDRDADHGMENGEPDGPDPVHVERSSVPPEGSEVLPGGIEERLHREPFLDDPVRGSEEEDARPPGLPAHRGLAHHKDARS